jgi:exodeoxyribonuclease VII large subunit
MTDKAITLCELLTKVKTAMKSALPYSWWVIAEISEIKVNFSGHCYLELIEKNDSNESIKAKVRATIWSSVYRMLQPYFQTTTQMELCSGIRVLLKVNAEFHELYGFSLNVTDIEPSYTLGELARLKQQIINRLISEGVYEMNRSLVMPEIPARIAVISSKTAAGFGDFLHQITNNSYGFKFYVKLFPAAMQGNEAEESVIKALDKIYKHEHLFDAVVIIRGGGAQSDLNCFNSYWLNLNICQFPLPVLTGIGHEQDETIADLVAYKRLKTPTAVAEYLIECFRNTADQIHERSAELYDMVTDRVRVENEHLNRILIQLKPAVKQMLTSGSQELKVKAFNLKLAVNGLLSKETSNLKTETQGLQTALREFIKNENHRLELLEKKNSYLDPFLILKRGYSITYLNGKSIKSAAEAKPDDIIETRLADGSIKSKTI